MANSKQPSRTPEEQKNASPAPATSPVAPEPLAQVFRVALCLEACTPCYGSGTSQAFGGEWITDTLHVNIIARDPHFKIYEGSRAELDAVMKEHADAFARLVAEAKPLGLTVSKHGELLLPRRR